jgi:hypothetical protein
MKLISMLLVDDDSKMPELAKDVDSDSDKEDDSAQAGKEHESPT